MNSMRKEEYEEIIEKYGNLVYRFALSITKHKDIADDVFQEVFLRYTKKEPVFSDDEHVKAWFFVVTRNCARNYFMTAFFRHSAPLTQDFPMLEKKEYGLYEEVMKLPCKYRIVIHLFYYEEYPTREIAKLLNIQDASVRTRLRRARELLKKQLKGSELDEIL